MDLLKLRSDPREFRQHLYVDVDGVPTRLADVIDDWQAADFAALDNGWCKAIGMPVVEDAPTYQRAYIERPRGHSKTNDLAVQVVWALFASGRKLSGVAGAADRDQAKLLRDAIERLVRLNPWLADYIDVKVYQVTNPHTGSELSIIASDVASSWGLTPDFIVCDEICHWKDGAENFWASLFSAAAKRGNCMLVVISNAGFGQGVSWQWTVREACRDDERWYFSRQDGPVASWITEDRLAEQRALLPPSAYQRLWLNIWTAGEGDCLDPRDIEKCITLDGPTPRRTDKYQAYIGSFDLGYRKDRSAFVVLAVDLRAARIALASCESWTPKAYGGELPLGIVKEAILDAHRRFSLDGVVFDPHQAVLMAQELAEEGLRMFQMWPTSQNNDLVAKSLLQRFYRGEIDIYEDKQLIRDLQALSIVEKQSGLRLVADRGADGHADTAIAFAMGLHVAYNEIHLILNREPASEQLYA